MSDHNEAFFEMLKHLQHCRCHYIPITADLLAEDKKTCNTRRAQILEKARITFHSGDTITFYDDAEFMRSLREELLRFNYQIPQGFTPLLMFRADHEEC